MFTSRSNIVVRLSLVSQVAQFYFDLRSLDLQLDIAKRTLASRPNDEPEAGKQLRLAQQYFFVSCSLQDMIRLHMMGNKKLDEFHSYWAVQLNDTHPAIAVAELMRLLVDEHLMDWDRAWTITQRTWQST